MIASVVARFTAEERSYFQGFVDASASGVAMELSRYDDHGEYDVDHLPAELESLDSPNDWDWLAKLYLVEQYHGMVERGEVTLRRNGDVYWIDPYDLIDVSVVSSEIVLAAVASSGSFRPGVGLSEASARTLRAKMPEPRPMDAPTEVAASRGTVQSRCGVGTAKTASRSGRSMMQSPTPRGDRSGQRRVQVPR